MSEGHNFENHEISPQPEVDFKSILESRELESIETLEGYFPIQIIKLKDDGEALFKPEAEIPGLLLRYNKKEFMRTNFEILATQIDEILGFGLVPVATTRAINGRNGVIQKRVEDATVAADIKGDWSELVDDSEILKAAVFDYLMDTRDRHVGNFLIDINARKIWLVDHDYIMFFETIIPYRAIINAAVRKNLVKLPEEIKKSIENLLNRLNSISTDNNPEIQIILNTLKLKAEELLTRGTLA